MVKVRLEGLPDEVQRIADALKKELLETGPREYDRLPDGRPYDGRPWWQA